MALQPERAKRSVNLKDQKTGKSKNVVSKGIHTMKKSSGNTGQAFVMDAHAVDGTRNSGEDALWLKSRVEVTDAYTSKDLGYITLIPEHRVDNKFTLSPGSTYKLSFDMYCLVPWQFFVADKANTDILPGVLIYSPTAGDGASQDAVLMSGGEWVSSNEPVTNGDIPPFVNMIDNGDFHDVSDTGILLDEDLAIGETDPDVDGTGVSTDTTWAGAHINKIFLSEGINVPGSNYNDTIGVCTSVTDDTQDKLNFAGYRSSTLTGSQIEATNNDKLYTLDGWKLNGGYFWPTWLSTSMTYSEDNHVLGMSHLDGGRNGTSVLKLSTHADLYQNPTSNSGNYLYQEMELDGNCWYDLHFKYSQTAVPSIDTNESSSYFNENAVTARLLYDVFDVETDSGHNRSLTNGWVMADKSTLESDGVSEGATGASGASHVNFTFAEQNSYYSHCNQYYDNLTDTLKFSYVRFFVPPRPTEANAVTVSIRFSMEIPEHFDNLVDKNHSVMLSYVCVKKSFPDLMSLITGRNTLAPVRGLSREYGLESHGSQFYDKWQNYELHWTVPEDYSEEDDWEIRFYGGAYGVTKTTRTALITGVTESGGTAQYTTSTSHGFSVGDRVTISGTTNFNDDKLSTNDIKAVASTTFDLLVSSAGDSDESSLTANVELVNSSYYPNTQVVGIKNIKLMSNNYKSGEEYSDHLLVLPDNKTDKTSFTLYHTNNNYWDTAFYVSNSFKFSPVYSYVDGLLQISDSDFTNTEGLIRWFYLKRELYKATDYNKFILTDNVFPPLGKIEVSQDVSPTLSGFNIDALKILGHTFESWEFWPKDDFTGFQSTSGTNHSDGNVGWHYKWFHHDQSYTDDNYSYISDYIANIPVKYIPENPTDVWTGDGLVGKNFRHSAVGSSSWSADKNWRTGGEPTRSTRHDGEQTEWEAAVGNNQLVNNPIYIPVMGTNGIVQNIYENEGIFGADNKDMDAALSSQVGYETDETGLYISSIEVDLNLFGRVVNNTYLYEEGDNILDDVAGENGTGGLVYSKWHHVPKIKIDVYKLQNLTGAELTNTDLTNMVENQGASSYLGPILASDQWPSPENESQIDNWIEEDEGSFMSDNSANTPKPDTGPLRHRAGYFSFKILYPMTLSFNTDGGNPSSITSKDNLIFVISMLGVDNTLIATNSRFNIMGTTGMNIRHIPDSGNNEWDDFELWDWTTNLGYRFSKLNINFHEPDVSAGDSFGSEITATDIAINFNFIGAIDVSEDEEGSDEVLFTDSWVGRKFMVGVSTVNHFDEESSIYKVDKVLGEDEEDEEGNSLAIQPGQAPDVAVAIGKDIIWNPLHKKVKIYIKDTEQNIWYKQLTIDTKTAKIKSSTSGKEFSHVIQHGTTNGCYVFEMKAKNMLFFNEVDSYESETLISQEDSENPGNLICKYKTSVHVNNRLYVGNIYQNGRSYGDRMLKTPIGKYNVFPASNYIDVAINDGDEITGLAYFKDKLLQFKKRKVFVINVSGDYEYLEDTLEHVGVNKQCQIATTPYGICWANSNGLFLYDGEELKNLIDNKIGSESYQENIINSGNYWLITASQSPSVGYISSSKKVIITRNTGYNSSAPTYSMTSASCDGFTYDFVSGGWTFLMNKLTCTPETTSSPQTGLLSNFVNNQDGDVLFYAVGTSADAGSINSIYKWDDESTVSNDSGNNEDYFTLVTKDFDFGSPGVRKKIYKVYVTFKSVEGTSHQNSDITVYYSTNGTGNIQNFSNSTNYSSSNGFFNAAGAVTWTVAELKPDTSSEANNVYSFQLSFKALAKNVPNNFQINDITIIYREKNIK